MVSSPFVFPYHSSHPPSIQYISAASPPTSEQNANGWKPGRGNFVLGSFEHSSTQVRTHTISSIHRRPPERTGLNHHHEGTILFVLYVTRLFLKFLARRIISTCLPVISDASSTHIYLQSITIGFSQTLPPTRYRCHPIRPKGVVLSMKKGDRNADHRG